jgi:geranylgeranyl diphosphate synthase type I
MQTEVVYGQQLDLMATDRVSVMQQLKTGSYTVMGPLRLGAALAGATEAQVAALEAYGEPLGEAFQIRDDLLGTFGNPKSTGKPRATTSGRASAPPWCGRPKTASTRTSGRP